MKSRRLLAAILLGVVLCFVVSGVGYGDIPEVLVNGHMEAWTKREPPLLNYLLLEAKIDYIMRHPDNYEYIWMRYDMDGSLRDFFEIPEGVNTADKIIIIIDDIREHYLQLPAQRNIDYFLKFYEILKSIHV